MDAALDFASLGYDIPSAPPGAWRDDDPADPRPGYFQFDWLSSRYPDLYDAFALSTEGLMDALASRFPLDGLDVVDIGAGTGRATRRAASVAAHVTAIDAFASVVEYGSSRARDEGLKNVTYFQADRSSLPLDSGSVDAVICAWAELDYREAYRVLRDGGLLIHMGAIEGSLCGELTGILAPLYPSLITSVADPALFDPETPDEEVSVDESLLEGITVHAPSRIIATTYRADYGDPAEAAAILGRIYGPLASGYMTRRSQATLAWRLSLTCATVDKTSRGWTAAGAEKEA